MAYTLVSPVLLGAQPFDETSTIQRHPLGTTATWADPTYGEAQAVYAKGVASTEQYSWVTLNPDDWSTALLVAGAAGKVGVSMSANAAATSYGWYIVSGKTPAKALAAFADNATVYATATAGSVDDAAVAGDLVSGALGASAVGTPSAGLAEFELDEPSITGTSAIGGAVTALTDNSGGAAADGTIGVVTAPTAIGATLTDSSGYTATHDDTLAATVAIVALTDNTGLEPTHDDTLAATAAPATLTDSSGYTATHDDTLAAVAAIAALTENGGALGGAQNGDITALVDPAGDAGASLIDGVRECASKINALCARETITEQNISDVAAKAIELVMLSGVIAQNASDTAQKVNELAARETITEQNISDVAAKVVELVAAQAENRTAIVALTDAVKELATKINQIIAA